jgi:archaellum component FlaC
LYIFLTNLLIYYLALVDDNLQLKSELQLAKTQINNLIQTSIQPSELESIKSRAQSLEEDYSALKIDFNTLKQENLA